MEPVTESRAPSRDISSAGSVLEVSRCHEIHRRISTNVMISLRMDSRIASIEIIGRNEIDVDVFKIGDALATQLALPRSRTGRKSIEWKERRTFVSFMNHVRHLDIT